MSLVQYCAWLYAAVWTFGPFIIAGHVIRRRSIQIVRQIDRTFLKLGAVSVRIGAVSKSEKAPKTAEFDMAVRSMRTMIEVCRQRLIEARVTRYWHPDRSAELIAEAEGLLQHIDIMIELCAARLPSVIRNAVAIMHSDVSKRHAALVTRIAEFGALGIPLGSERRLSAEVRESINRFSRTEGLDIAIVTEILSEDLRTIAEIDSHLNIRERVWRTVESDDAQISTLVGSIEATGMLATAGFVDAQYGGNRWANQARAVAEKIANDVKQVRDMMTSARSRCNPGKQKFSRPDGDLERLVLAVQDSARAVTLARQTLTLAQQTSQAMAASASSKAQA